MRLLFDVMNQRETTVWRGCGEGGEFAGPCQVIMRVGERV